MSVAGTVEGSWDAIVIGAGMGGGIVGRALVEHGLTVLFLEKGRAGWRAEETGLEAGVEDPVARRLRGAWPDPIEVTQDGRRQTFFAPLGSGVGGSSVFYAATLERPDPREIDGSWPIPYEALRPCYDRSEAILSIHGEPDPLSEVACPELRVPPSLNVADARIAARLRANGMHPYRLHTALRYLPGCAECLGRKCPRPCKMDGRSAGVEPALASGRATLLDECDVLRLDGTGRRVTSVQVRRGGQTLSFQSPRIVLAAGALSTPRLLLASTSEDWPQGCGNASGQVGRHLMLHLNEMFAVWPGRLEAPEGAGPSKGIGLRDLMRLGDARGGMVQALGVDAREPLILHALRTRLATSRLGRTRLAREAARLPAKVAARTLGTAKLFVGLLEDLPSPTNRVLLDPARPSRIVVDYQVPDELQARRALFRAGIQRAFRGLRPLFLNYAPEPNWGHPCGTTRMGASTATSVVDPSCRVHGMDNLWIVDSGVFPTSLGVNPSLTIAANALRVASHVATSPAR